MFNTPPHFIKSVTILFLVFYSISGSTQAFFEVPIEGTQGNEWIIVNYVDWDTLSYLDHNCGSKTYDGHQGTDFTLKSFDAMNDSIKILAAADGVVTFVIDSLFDKETEGNVLKRLGNYIAISHPNKYYTYYAHLMTNSSQVSVGDTVKQGDVIAYVGSSGNSTDPHLHFELWYDSLFVVDPFQGACGNPGNLFLDPPSYDTSLVVWESGFHQRTDLNIDDLRFRIDGLKEPYQIRPSSDSSFYYWAQIYGLKQGAELKVQWYTPQNTLWFEFPITLDRDYWYYYYWTYINHINLSEGVWHVNLLYENMEIDSRTFEVKNNISPNDEISIASCDTYQSQSLVELINQSNLTVKIYRTDGSLTYLVGSNNLKSGIYLIEIMNRQGEICTLKRHIP